MASTTRWAGVSREGRLSGRREMVLRAAFDLFGRAGEKALSVRSICRETGLHHRYFYENFADVNDLLGAMYDGLYAELRRALTIATENLPDDRARLRAGIRAVLDFSAGDPRRGQILFTAAPANPALIERRIAARTELREYIFRVRLRADPASDPVAAEVAAAIYAGATTELNQQWLAGALGDDLDLVIEHAVAMMTTSR